MKKYKDTFEVINENAVNSVKIVSTNGTTEFIHDRGKTTLICEVDGEGAYTYHWNKIDNSGVNIPLTNENGDSQQILNTTNLAARTYLLSITNDNPTKKFIKPSSQHEAILNGLGISYKNLSNEQVYNNVQSYLIEKWINLYN